MRRRRIAPPGLSKVERHYRNQLWKVARAVGDIIGAFPAGDPEVEPQIRRALEDYSELLTGWAKAVGARMVGQVEQEDEKQWRARADEMSRALQDELRNTPIGPQLQARLAEQVTYIKSIPLDAAQRVHEFTLKSLEDSSRAKEYAAEIERTEEVSKSRATLIARTEVARTSSLLTETRARAIGSEGYIWRTAEDGDVRDSHKEMNGKYVRWDTPPTLSDGTTTHAGQIYNCRCYPEPVIPED